MAVSCTDYKILAKCLSNRLKPYLHYIIIEYQTYYISKIKIMDNLFLVRDIMDIVKIKVKMLDYYFFFPIDQEIVFNRAKKEILFWD